MEDNEQRGLHTFCVAVLHTSSSDQFFWDILGHCWKETEGALDRECLEELPEAKYTNRAV